MTIKPPFLPDYSSFVTEIFVIGGMDAAVTKF